MKIKYLMCCLVIVLAAFYFTGCDTDTTIATPILESCYLTSYDSCLESYTIDQQKCIDGGNTYSNSCPGGQIGYCEYDSNNDGYTETMYFYAPTWNVSLATTFCNNEGGTYYSN